MEEKGGVQEAVGGLGILNLIKHRKGYWEKVILKILVKFCFVAGCITVPDMHTPL